jgi:hypothetical protein
VKFLEHVGGNGVGEELRGLEVEEEVVYHVER